MRLGYLTPALCTLLLAGTVAACGSASDNGVASKPPNAILASARQAINGARSVHVSGTVSSNGTPINLDLHLVTGKGGEGQMATSGLSFQLVSLDNSVYIKGTPAFWRHFGGAAAATLFAGKWLKAPASGDFASFAALTNLPQLFSSALGTHGSLTKGKSTTAHGRSVVPLKDAAQGGTLYVATTGTPYPIEIAKPGAAGGRINFDQFNQSVPLTAPTDAIDITQLAK